MNAVDRGRAICKDALSQTRGAPHETHHRSDRVAVVRVRPQQFAPRRKHELESGSQFGHFEQLVQWEKRCRQDLQREVWVG